MLTDRGRCLRRVATGSTGVPDCPQLRWQLLPSIKVAASLTDPLLGRKMAAGGHRSWSLVQDGSRELSPHFSSWQSPPFPVPPCPHPTWRLTAQLQAPPAENMAASIRFPLCPPATFLRVASAASRRSAQRWRKRLRAFEFQRSRQSRAQRSCRSGRRRDPRAVLPWTPCQGKT